MNDQLQHELIRQIKCPTCQNFAWHGDMHQPKIRAIDGTVHHPACRELPENADRTEKLRRSIGTTVVAHTVWPPRVR